VLGLEVGLEPENSVNTGRGQSIGKAVCQQSEIHEMGLKY